MQFNLNIQVYEAVNKKQNEKKVIVIFCKC